MMGLPGLCSLSSRLPHIQSIDRLCMPERAICSSSHTGYNPGAWDQAVFEEGERRSGMIPSAALVNTLS